MCERERERERETAKRYWHTGNGAQGHLAIVAGNSLMALRGD